MELWASSRAWTPTPPHAALGRSAGEEFHAKVDAYRASWIHAEVLPWLSGIRTDSVGNVWVQEYRHRFDEAADVWGVFGSDGRWLGRVEMPHGFTPDLIGERTVLGVARDELGIEYVRECSLRKD